MSIPVGPRPLGGFEGELDVVAVHPARHHLLHVECSLDALSDAQRQPRFAAKFERGRKFVPEVLKGFDLPGEIDQVAVLQFASGRVRNIGGARLVTVRELVVEIRKGLAGTSPASGAVSANLPLLRTLQLAADAFDRPFLDDLDQCDEGGALLRTSHRKGNAELPCRRLRRGAAPVAILRR